MAARSVRVWAPHATRADLVVDDVATPMRREGDDFAATVEAADGDRYGFSLDGGEVLPDPRGLRMPDGHDGRSAFFDPTAFPWGDAGWTGAPLEGAVIYELHVGTWTPEGTLDAAAARLGHLVDLGVTVVELLPLAPFPGAHGWGYDGIAPYAVHEAYGGPAALQRFVDAAHARGLGVCLDVVYNHLGPDGNRLAEFGPYLTDAHATPWGDAVNLDAPGCDPVRRWVLDNARQWFADFHVDGLRLDAVHELHDRGALHLLEEMARETDELAEVLGRPLWLVAESDRNDPGTVTPRGEGQQVAGLGLHGQWSDDVHHALHVALTGEAQGYYADFADPAALRQVLGRSPFFHAGTWSTFRGRVHGRPVDPAVPGWRFVASLQTHDQVGNRAVGDRLSASLAPDRLACGAALLLTAPWTPMLFMGEEWGASTPWMFFTDHTDPEIAEATRRGRKAEFGSHGWDEADVPDPQDPATFERSRLDWSEPGREPHARLLRWYRDLIALRRATSDLHAADLSAIDVHWDQRTGRFASHRGDHLVLVNLGAEPWTCDDVSRVVLAWDPAVAVHDGTVVVPPQTAVVAARS
jgi:maltooligosyltrehalose trehalohydrolase